jgi:HK97 family phage major capsid protein
VNPQKKPVNNIHRTIMTTKKIPSDAITASVLRSGECPVMHRDMSATVEKVDEDSRLVEISFSSEFAVERWGWVETLGHNEGECDLSRINDKGPYLCDHNHKDQRGVIEKAWLEGGRGHAQIKLSRNPLGQQLLLDMQDGIRVNVSVGYRIHEAVLTKREDDLEHYRVTRWEPLEISSVSVPADPTVGFGRSDQQITNPVTIKEVKQMAEIEALPTPAPAESRSISPETPNQPVVERKAPVATPAPTGKTDAQRIAEAAEQYGATELGNQHIRKGSNYDEFQRELMDNLHKKRKDPEAESTLIDLDLPAKDLKRYSLIAALRGAATGNFKKAGLEREVSNAIAQRSGEDAQGLYLSYEALGYKLRQQQLRENMTRLQSVGGAGLGAELVGTELHSEMFIEALRAKAVLGRLGARFMSGLVGNLDIPKKISSASFYWVAEDGSPSVSNVGFGVVQMSPKTIATAVELTRRLMIQSTPDIEMLVLNDILYGLSLGIDNAGFLGSGVSNQPLGIVNTSGIGAVTLSATPTWAEMVELETDIAEANADANGIANLMRPSMAGELKTTVKAAGTASYLMENGVINGYPVETTTQMPVNTILSGDFTQMMVGMWGALDVVPDKSTKASSGGLVMRLFQDMDIATRHAQAFTLAEKV